MINSIRHSIGKIWYYFTGRETKHYRPVEERVSEQTRFEMFLLTGLGNNLTGRKVISQGNNLYEISALRGEFSVKRLDTI